MKRYCGHLLLMLIIVSVQCSKSRAQTPLPYYTGFETTAEKAGWVEFSQGNISTETWSLGVSGFGATNTLISPNAEFTSSTFADTIIQWYVSPGFNFHAGGKLDSLSIYVFQASGTPVASDSIVLYLLKGSNNPLLATSRIRIANLTPMAKGFGGRLRDTGNFVIPPTSGTSYLAFKYFGVYDWFQVYIDSIYLSGNPTTKINMLNEQEQVISIYPNPANTEMKILFRNDDAKKASMIITNIMGQKMLTHDIVIDNREAKIDIRHLPTGTYNVEIVTDTKALSKQHLIITR